MKYCVLIIDGASGWPIESRGGRTCLELAFIPNLDVLASQGVLGLSKTVPDGMEPSSACACMSIMGYDPRVYYRGRSAIEAAARGIHIGPDEVVFRCNLVSVTDGRMADYSAGHISSSEARVLVNDLQKELGDGTVDFYAGISYRNICKLKGHSETLQAACTPPHDIPGKIAEQYLPSGPGSGFLRELMLRSWGILSEHPVNKSRVSRGEAAANMIWLFWGSGEVPAMPDFRRTFGVDGAITTAVDLLKGLAKNTGIKLLDISGVTDGPDNDYVGQVKGALKSLEEVDLVFIHVEAPDEAAHGAKIDEKIGAIERIDSEIVGRLKSWNPGSLRILAMPDHATPIEVRTHVSDAVPFVIWGQGIDSIGNAGGFNEAQARETGVFFEEGYRLMHRFIKE